MVIDNNNDNDSNANSNNNSNRNCWIKMEIQKGIPAILTNINYIWVKIHIF